jgi:hypothetical protein
MTGKVWIYASMVLCLSIQSLFTQDLSLGPDDLRIEQGIDGGYHLFIRKKADIGSVLLTESTKDPQGRSDNYAYRSPEYNPINGDEVRILDGKPISKDLHLWSLIDSSPQKDNRFNEAFEIYIPYVINYGYPSGRHGEVYVVDGTYLNIRAFKLPFADYRGPFKDNPFVLKVTQRPLPGPPEGNYMKDTVDSFKEIASAGNGELLWSTGKEDVVPKIKKILEDAKGKTVDLVVTLDTTESMQDDIDPVRRMLIPMIQDILKDFKSFRIGMVLYKDYFEEYLNKVIPFTDNFATFQNTLNAIRVGGGRDIPEAVYEALYEAATKFPWSAEEKIIILIGDAPPHPRPRGSITKAMVDGAVKERGLKVNAIILPQ